MTGNDRLRVTTGKTKQGQAKKTDHGRGGAVPDRDGRLLKLAALEQAIKDIERGLERGQDAQDRDHHLGPAETRVEALIRGGGAGQGAGRPLR